MKMTLFCLLPFALTASDGSYGKLLQLQDGPEGGRPSLSDCQQQQREGRTRHHIADISLRARWHGFTRSFSSSCQSYISLPVLSLQIVIPFFSLLIKDIYFLNEGCANRLPNGHVNFEVSQSLFFHGSALLNHPKNFFTQCNLSFLEICGVGTAGWGVHDVETGGVSI